MTVDAPPDRVDAERVETPASERWITRRRHAKWATPRGPLTWRWFVSIVGRILIATGLMLFGFVGYQLYGTGLETARAQRALANEFEELLSATTTTPATTTPATTTPGTTAPAPTTAPPTTVEETDGVVEPEPAPEPEPEPEPPGVDQDLPLISVGDPIARLEIPSIGVEDIVIAGIGVGQLQQGPGHFPSTPLPGQLGNAAIAGHRTTYGQPFRNVDRLEPGDEIIVTTLAGRFVYRVTGSRIVTPQDSQVVATTRPDVAVITLVSCHPVWSAAQRIIVSGELDVAASAPAGRPEPYSTSGRPAELPTEVLDAPAPTEPTTAPEPTAPDSTATDSTAPDSTVPDSTVPDSTVPDSTVPADTVPDDTVPDTVPADQDSSGVDAEIEDAFARGWFHDDGAFAQIAVWGAALSMIAILSYLISRRFRRDLLGFTIGVAPFAVAAFFFFQNVNRLLPPNL